jgi:hypothetical protein
MAIGTFEAVKPHLLKHEGGYVIWPSLTEPILSQP